MKRVLTTASLVLLSLFLVRLTPVYGAAQGAADKLVEVVVTNFPEIFNTREQNLDVDGNIKVHEQGTINVNVANTEPIAVSVGGVPLQPKTVTLYENRAMTPGEYLVSPFIDVEGYKKLTLYIRRPIDGNPANYFNFNGGFSIDDTTRYKGRDAAAIATSLGYGEYYKYETLDVLGPKFYLSISNSGAEAVSAWVYLTP